MKVLVAYATRHGATRGIAERVADTLKVLGLEVDLRTVADAGDVSHYDAFVIGSAAYMGTWLKDASTFVRRHERELARRPVWLFSSGPIGTDRIDKQGRDVVEASVPAEFRTFDPLIHPRDEHVFFGAWDPDAEPAGFADRFVRGFGRLFPSIKAEMPAGDFRDWPEIEAWAEGIARDLAPSADARVPTPA
jgi:menaquinone-dependent protoporphyrinogen oxidase